MTDQNEREWPSFGDILEELNSLGGLTRSSSPVEPTGEPAPAHDSGDSKDDFEDEEHEEHPEPVSTADTGIDLGPTAIDWSKWELESGSVAQDPFAPTFAPSPVSDSAPTPVELDSDTEIFEFDPSAFEPETGSEADPPESSDVHIDSVATANEIETDLQELFDFVQVDEDDQTDGDDHDDHDGELVDTLTDAAEIDPPVEPHDELVATESEQAESDERESEEPDTGPDNVVPLHRSTDNSEHVMGLDELFDPAHPQPVVEEPSSDRPMPEFRRLGEPVEDTPTKDSWEYLRPHDDDAVPVGGGIWSRRPKFFGGDERKSRKADRKRAQDEADLNGPPCPRCDAPGHIDLDDPIGGKIHCSCRNCDHVWSEYSRPAEESA